MTRQRSFGDEDKARLPDAMKMFRDALLAAERSAPPTGEVYETVSPVLDALDSVAGVLTGDRKYFTCRCKEVPGSKAAGGVMTLEGQLRLSTPDRPGLTCGQFGKWMAVNDVTLQRYFGVALFHGSLNVDIVAGGPRDLHRELDERRPVPRFTIPRIELKEMSAYLGDAQVWNATLFSVKLPAPHRCWLLRRIHSLVPFNVLELVSTETLVSSYG